MSSFRKLKVANRLLKKVEIKSLQQPEKPQIGYSIVEKSLDKNIHITKIQEDFSSYTIPQRSTYTDEQRDMLEEFYKVLAKKFRPDLNHDRDTTAEMQLLNSLKSKRGP